ncbi:MAG TPA: hypothetical protein PKE37_16145, partial [Thiomonas arsenitoxydans]|uniref:hypothetical protein n=1 Tax=Thiomonas arsenitoxydans (strain DSM 22701 / CIP 110005 / 3As) TaxID=426114 RepID=UPI002C3D0082
MKTMDDLRSVIFDTIDDVRKSKIDAATARAISDLAQNVINSAKAEADYARATGQVVRSGLISTEPAAVRGKPRGTPPPANIRKAQAVRVVMITTRCAHFDADLLA